MTRFATLVLIGGLVAAIVLGIYTAGGTRHQDFAGAIGVAVGLVGIGVVAWIYIQFIVAWVRFWNALADIFDPPRRRR